MTDAQDPLAEAKAGAAYWSERVADLEGQTPEPVPETPEQTYAVPSTNLPEPHVAVREAYEDGARRGLREEDILANAVRALAAGGEAGDERYLVQSRPITVGGVRVA